MSQIVIVEVYYSKNNTSAENIRVELGGGYGSTRTNDKGEAIFKLPDNVSSIDVFVNGKFVCNEYISNFPIRVLVSDSGYFEKRI